jgi:hypothetical protein
MTRMSNSRKGLKAKRVYLNDPVILKELFELIGPETRQMPKHRCMRIRGRGIIVETVFVAPQRVSPCSGKVLCTFRAPGPLAFQLGRWNTLWWVKWHFSTSVVCRSQLRAMNVGSALIRKQLSNFICIARFLAHYPNGNGNSSLPHL